jgi:hypothetical protein
MISQKRPWVSFYAGVSAKLCKYLTEIGSEISVRQAWIARIFDNMQSMVSSEARHSGEPPFTQAHDDNLGLARHCGPNESKAVFLRRNQGVRKPVLT